MTQFLKSFLFIILLILTEQEAKCNNVQLSNISIEEIDVNSQTAKIEFDVSWQNSWRNTGEPYNWDAVWIFAKVRKNGSNWEHLKLTNSLPTIPNGVSTSIGLSDPTLGYNSSTNPGVGVFIHRGNSGNGDFTVSNIKLNWDFTLNDIQSNDILDLKLFAIEMVYIPEGSFYVGDNATSDGSLRQGSSDNDPWYIPNEDAISTTNSLGSGTGVGGNNLEYFFVRSSLGIGPPNGSTFTISAIYPKGFSAFYSMKYEITQRQWIEFFNTLTPTQKSARDITASNSNGKNSDALRNRNNVNWTSGNAILNGGTHGDVACNFLGESDLLAFLDWSGLRPMSDLEFEKIARGANNLPVSGELVWGNTVSSLVTSINNEGQSNETPNSGANLNYDTLISIDGPIRVGSFANANSTRVQSGSSYYGVMELGGNLFERVIGLQNTLLVHGDGEIDVNGNSNSLNYSLAFRGSSYVKVGAETAQTSDRYYSDVFDANRYSWLGGRGVRNAP
jgi:formylglycine-generating enzyme required for sulfatase activity